jgi:hypothetical protein
MKFEENPEKELIANMILQAFMDFEDLVQSGQPKKEHCMQGGAGCGLIVEAKQLLKFFFDDDGMEEWIHISGLEIDPESIRCRVRKIIQDKYGSREAWLLKVQETQSRWNVQYKLIRKLKPD